MLIRLTVVIILHYKQISNHYVVHLKLICIMLYVNYTSVLKKRKRWLRKVTGLASEGQRDRSKGLAQALFKATIREKTLPTLTKKKLRQPPKSVPFPQVIRFIVKLVYLIQHLETFFRINVINLNPDS